MDSKDEYLKAMQTDKEEFADYFMKYLNNKSEQQKLLEKIIVENEHKNTSVIGDIACGAGTLSFHISKLYPQSEYYLMDINDNALEQAKNTLKEVSTNIINNSIYDLSFYKEKFDLVFCWQTLSWLDNPEGAMQQLVNSCKKGGTIYLSSLFNLNHDVDVYSKVIDNTRASGKNGLAMSYNTYSASTVDTWLAGKVNSYKFHEFNPEIDFEYNGRGIGTYTIETKNKKRLQISAGMLMSWSILEINK
jgi:ubiquinone/menaquinone biosynthesis C-methylase UbiE